MNENITYLSMSIEKNIEELINYRKTDAIDYFVKLLFETIMNLERRIFLNDSVNKVGGQNKGNGYYNRLVRALNKYIQVQIPRDRLSLFKPEFLNVIKEREGRLLDLGFKLYSKGLTTRDIEDVFKEIFDKKLSRSSISRITKEFQTERELWQKRRLEEEYYVIYIDALQIPVRRETVEKEAFYVLIGLRKDLRRDILGIYNIPLETSAGWQEVLTDLKQRGCKHVLLMVSDQLSGISEVISEEFPLTHHQLCIVHKKRNVLKRLRKSDKSEIMLELKEVFKLEDRFYTYEKGCKKLEEFLTKWGSKYPSLLNQFIPKDFKYYFAYLNMPPSIHRMIYTTNWIERLNKSFRRTLRMRNALPSVDSVLNLMCAYAIDYENRVYSHPVTAFKPAQDELNNKLELLRQRCK